MIDRSRSKWKPMTALSALASARTCARRSTWNGSGGACRRNARAKVEPRPARLLVSVNNFDRTVALDLDDFAVFHQLLEISQRLFRDFHLRRRADDHRLGRN